MFYRSIMAKYASIRAFDTPNEGAAGGASATEAKTGDDAAAAAAADEKKLKDAQDAAAAAADAAAQSDDPKLKAAAAEKADLLREVMDKKTKLKAAQDDAAAAKKALEAYEGIDPAKVRELMRKELDAERAAAEAKGDFDRVKAMMAEEHQKELAKIKDELEAERTNRKGDQSLIDELTIGNSFGNSDFIRDNLTISPAKARRLYGDHFERQGGVVVAYDKPAGEANRTLLVNAKGDPLSFDEALGRVVDADPDKKGVLKSKAKPGAGSSTDIDKSKNDKHALSGKAAIVAAVKDL
jgi:hypothetical protein